MADIGSLWDAVLGDDTSPKAVGFSKAERAAACEREAARDLEERKARLQASKEALARLPHYTLSDGTVARSHRIRKAAGGTVHAVASGKSRAACGSAPGLAGSWSTALDEMVSCPRCLRKIVG